MTMTKTTSKQAESADLCLVGRVVCLHSDPAFCRLTPSLIFYCTNYISPCGSPTHPPDFLNSSPTSPVLLAYVLQLFSNHHSEVLPDNSVAPILSSPDSQTSFFYKFFLKKMLFIRIKVREICAN